MKSLYYVFGIDDASVKLAEGAAVDSIGGRWDYHREIDHELDMRTGLWQIRDCLERALRAETK